MKAATCAWTHCAGDGVAVGRFSPDGPMGFRAKSGGPLRATRNEAIADECAAAHKTTTEET